MPPPVLLARGQDIWPYLDRLNLYEPTTFTHLGVRHTAEPFTQYGKEEQGGFLFITNFLNYGSVYYANDELRRQEDQILFRNGLFLQAALQAGYKVKWVLPVYKALIAFGLQAIPFGKWAGRAVSLLSLASFWRNHKQDIDAGIDLSKTLIDDLRALYLKCPALTKTMLLIAMEEVASDFKSEIRGKGIFHVISSRLDGEKYMETVATFFGSLLKLCIGSSGKGVPGWLSSKGFERLGRVAKTMLTAYKYLGLMQKGAAVARGPGIKDAHLAPTAFLNEFANANLRVLPIQIDCRALQKEGCLSDERTRQRIESIGKSSERIHVLLKQLTEQAEWEVF
jgi:hypothetical protein